MKKKYLIKSKILFKLYLFYFGFKYKFFIKKKSLRHFFRNDKLEMSFSLSLKMTAIV